MKKSVTKSLAKWFGNTRKDTVRIFRPSNREQDTRWTLEEHNNLVKDNYIASSEVLPKVTMLLNQLLPKVTL